MDKPVIVVNCFQISIFAVHEQQYKETKEAAEVVNCFQISIFAVHEQRRCNQAYSIYRCELLSN